VAENQPANKNRMTTELSNFVARLREFILSEGRVIRGPDLKGQNGGSYNSPLRDFNRLAIELFALQFKNNAAYRKICEARGLTPKVIEHWTRIPTVPTSAFKELELTCLAPAERTTVFHSSGTTEQKPSWHFHSPESLKVYEASLWPWFRLHFGGKGQLVFLTPSYAAVPHSSLVYMFDTVRRKFRLPESAFVGQVAKDGSWALDFDALLPKLKVACDQATPLTLLGTAFSFVHMLDYLVENNLCFRLPKDSRVMETGGYKNRSRSLPKAELHQLVTNRLGVLPENIICEYGMSELSSQAYDGTIQANDLNLPHPGPLPKERENCCQSAGESVAFGNSKAQTLLFPLPEGEGQGEGKRTVKTHYFHFPPWVRIQIISPETGREVADGETGLIRVFDLANVFSVMAVQTEDLGIRRGEHFELIGRAALAEPRGCSLMTHSAIRIPQSAIK
jgi:hypothetical protein